MTYYGAVRHSDPLIQEAITSAARSHPYYMPAIARLRIVADTNVATMATSAQWVTHYNPTTVAGWTAAERGAVLVHEVEHLLRQHHERCGERDPKNWNIAGDAEINQRLDNLPDGAVYPETLGMPRGSVAERYYGAAGNGQGPDGQGQGQGPDGQGQPGAGAGQPGPGEPGNCGSAAGGPTQPHEAGDAARPGAGAGNDDAVRREVAEEVLQSGSMPGSDAGDEMRDWAEGTLGIDRAAWYRALAGIVGKSVATYGAPTRWRWPGRRDMSDVGGAMVPRWVGERPSCAVVIDTSSSITPYDLDMAKAAGYFIGRVADVTYYACDTRPQALGSTLPDRLPGGGGTHMPNGIRKAIEDGAAAVIVITDMETDWTMDIPNVPVIIGANLSASRHLASDGADWWYNAPDWMTVLPLGSGESE